jgi:hypothetical protein
MTKMNGFRFSENNLTSPQISCMVARPAHRGVFRERHERGPGCGGRKRRQAHNRALDETLVAYGEVVWS